MTTNGQHKRKGMLGDEIERKSGNYVPKESYEYQQNKDVASKETSVNTSDKTETVALSKVSKSNERKNQQAQLKISKTLKEEIIAIKTLTSTKYEYEVIQLLIDQYKKSLTPEDVKKLRLISELNIS